ncbi:MAG: hypothetical protein JWL77_1513 [Chthonomonadaceae bacterium]|nr:hypothetical protein [Chthonomonadaceae bacterium]
MFRYGLSHFRFWSAILAACSLNTVHAQSKTDMGIPITRNNALPASITHQIPAKARSLFWGTFATMPTASNVIGVHVYLRHMPGAANFTRHSYVLDIYSQRRGETRFQRVNRMVFHCPDVYFLPSETKAKWIWLNDSTHGDLALTLHIGSEYDHGDDIFVGLSGGLSARNKPLAIEFGTWHASDICGIRNEFIHGKQGRTEIEVTLWPAGDPAPAIFANEFQFTLEWKETHKRFWPTAKARRILKDYEFLRREIIP